MGVLIGVARIVAFVVVATLVGMVLAIACGDIYRHQPGLGWLLLAVGIAASWCVVSVPVWRRNRRLQGGLR